MSWVLGLNAYHADASACLLKDGALVAAVAEERLGSRRKHDAGFPAEAIKAVLRIGGIGMRDVSHVAIGHDSDANLAEKTRYALLHPIATAGRAMAHLKRRRGFDSIAEEIAARCGIPDSEMRFEAVHVEHHLAHIASSFWSSRFEEAAGFSYDATGDFVSAMYAACSGGRIDVLGKIHMPVSLGIFYTAVCQFIGFDRFGEEYKVMGLAAYGKPTYLAQMERMIAPAADGRLSMDQSWFRAMAAQPHQDSLDERGEIVVTTLHSPRMASELGPPRARGADLTQRDKDLAASCQAHFERLVLHCLGHLRGIAPSDNLVTAGGCALNGVCNARILRESGFKRSYIQCAASDDGTAIGAALWAWNQALGGTRSPAIDHAYWGPEHDDAAMAEALRAAGLTHERLDRGTLIARAVDGLLAGRVLGWYQGRSEWGPRALGNRSILAHPGFPGMKDLINRKIKRREAFRPFAPTILAEAVRDWFEQEVESPFMMHVVKIRPERRAALAAVCHEDATGRLHTVSRAQNPLYYDLISAFAGRSGVPVVLNTSFNENEPIVDTPAQAVSCFVRNDIDELFLGPFHVAKRPDPAASGAATGP
jgi:carbamoyltransferase